MMTKMKLRTLAAPIVFGLALSALTSAPARAQSSATAPAQVSAEDFAALEWLEGRWIGSGGDAGAFYEEYRILDDGRIEQIRWSDSTFTTPVGRSTIEYLGGYVMKSRDGQVESLVTRMADDEIRFAWAESGRPGFTWSRVSDDEWVAVLDRRGEGPVVYNMRRTRGNG